ncbi:MAG: T9SS type A sorting domain-containing protein [Flavobacteriaceae bacterium]|nr:T9SS type A sorting domain-containing protein [Flavobacteriaceae bacterium]
MVANHVVGINLRYKQVGKDKKVCNGDSIRHTAPSGYNSYYWYTGVLNQSIYGWPGNNYVITVTDYNKCTQTDSIRVFSYIPNAAFTFSQTGGNNYNFSQVVSTYTIYVWDFGDGNSSLLKSPSHVYNVSNTYTSTLKVKDSAAWSASSSQTISVSIINTLSGLPERQPEITAYPNPTDDNMLVQWTKRNAGADLSEIFDMTGKCFYRTKFTGQQTKVLFNSEQFNYQKGIFLIRVSNGLYSQTLRVEWF